MDMLEHIFYDVTYLIYMTVQIEQKLRSFANKVRTISGPVLITHYQVSAEEKTWK